MTKNINKLFSPSQGLSEISNRSDIYSEYLPHKSLRKYIICYWSMFASGTLRKEYIKDRIIADGCTDIIFYINKFSREYSCEVVGMMSNPIIVEHKSNETQCFGIRFYPGGLYPFLKDNLVQITDKVIPLDNIINSIPKDIGNKIAESKSIKSMILTADNYFLKLESNNFRENNNLKNILYQIYISSGDLNINELSTKVGLSTRQIRRLFSSWIGLSPKQFCRIVRFQNTLKVIKEEKNISLLNIALNCGFFDQPHLTKDFKELGNITPGEIILKKMSDSYKKKIL